MDTNTKAYIFKEGGRILGAFVRLQMARPKAPTEAAVAEKEIPPVEKTETSIAPPDTAEVAVIVAELPTSEETTRELKRRLARELYKAELDLSAGLKIVGKPCDCLENKHTLELEAAAEELIASEPENPVYSEIIAWIKESQHKVTVPAIASGHYAEEYPRMASLFKDFRKRVMGTAAFSALEEAEPKITLEEAKKLASDEAAKEVEKRWDSKEQAGG